MRKGQARGPASKYPLHDSAYPRRDSAYPQLDSAYLSIDNICYREVSGNCEASEHGIGIAPVNRLSITKSVAINNIALSAEKSITSPLSISSLALRVPHLLLSLIVPLAASTTKSAPTTICI